MHCDDKRTLFVLKQGIEETWNALRASDFADENLVKKLNEETKEYFECKSSS